MKVYNGQLVTAPYAFGFLGDGITRCAVLAIPSANVRSLLPANLELGDQNVAPTGTHPVVMLFHGFIHCQFSFPTFLQPMRFHEQTFGIPFTRVRASNYAPGGAGPYYFMPRLYLDDPWVWMIGRTYWGFEKEMAIVNASESSYTVTSLAGQRLASLRWSNGGNDPRPAMEDYHDFDPLRLMLSQPLISFSPVVQGTVPTLTDFGRNWNLATVRPIQSVLEIDRSYMQGFEGGRYVLSGDSVRSTPSLLASYELSAPWWLSFPYFPSLGAYPQS